MKCWESKTPFQMALILMLIVAVPFFIAMIILYIMFGVVWPQSESCKNLCCVLELNGDLQPEFPSDTNTTTNTTTSTNTTTFRNSTTSVNRTTSINRTTVENSRFYRRAELIKLPVGALLETLHSDEVDEFYFKCEAVVISSSLAVAADTCVQSGVTDIRTGSQFWSEGGFLGKIKNSIRINVNSIFDLAIVNFEKLDFEGTSYGGVWSNKELWSVKWKSNLELPLFQRKKYYPLNIYNINPHGNTSCEIFNKGNFSCYLTRYRICEKNLNAPMLDDDFRLVGFHLETFCPENTDFAVVFYVKF